jgi:hypothetical protein
MKNDLIHWGTPDFQWVEESRARAGTLAQVLKHLPGSLFYAVIKL